MVSVIIPTYNRATLISETIKSVLKQTYSDFEAIIVSDGASGDTRKAVESFSDRRLKYYEISHSGRPAVARNFGISRACGEYLAFCDDDDIWFPEKLSLQVARANSDKEIGLCYTKCLLKSGNSQRIVPSDARQGFIFRRLFLSFDFIATSTVLLRAEVLAKLGDFNESFRLKVIEDFDLWLRISKSYKVGIIDKPLVVHRESSDSLSRGAWPRLKRQCMISLKFYREKYVGLGLFIGKILLTIGKTVLELLNIR